MKKFLILFTVIAAITILAGCENASESPAIQPTEGKLTFAFFYTDG